MSQPVLITFLAYLVLMTVIGAVAWFRTRGLFDYLIGGRNMSAGVTALSAGASDMSGWLLLGLPGAVYVSGLGESWIVLGLVLGAWLNWQLVARRLRADTQVYESLTLPDYFENRFEDKSKVLRLVSSVIILIFFTFYVASGLVAGAKLFSSTFGFSYQIALLTGGLIIVAYTAIGGFLAVSWTDVVQALLMAVALVAVPWVMMSDMGGMTASLQKLETVNPSSLNFWEGVSGLTIVSLLAWGLGYFGQPHILARFMAIRSPGVVGQAKWIAMSWMLITTIAAVAIGLLGIAYLDGSLASSESEKIFIRLTQLIFNPWIAGVLLAAILAAIMSTVDSQLLVSSSSLSQDFYKAWIYKGASQKQMVFVGRITVLIVAGIALLIASDPNSLVLGLVSYAWAGLGASFGPVVLFALYSRKTTNLGVLTGMIIGAVTVIVWSKLEGGLFDLYEMVPAFVLNCLSIWLVSLTHRWFRSRKQSVQILSID